MDGQNPFSQQGQDPLPPLNSYDSNPNQQSYYTANNTWPLMYNQTMSNQTTLGQDESSIHATSSGSLDMKPTTSMAPMPSPPTFTMGTHDLQSNPITTTSSHGRNNSVATSLGGLQLGGFGNANPSANLQIRTSMGTTQPSIQQSHIMQQAFDASATMLQTAGLFPLQNMGHPSSYSDSDSLPYTGAFDMPLHSSPTEEFIATTQAQMAAGMELLAPSTMDQMTTMGALVNPATSFAYQDLAHMMTPSWQHVLSGMGASPYGDPTIAQSSPEQNLMDARSLSSLSDDHSWTMVEHGHGRASLDGYSDSSAVVSPTILHVRASSESSHHSDNPPPSARSRGSFEELFAISPEPELRADQTHYSGLREYPFAANTEFDHPIPSPPLPSPHSAAAGPSALPLVTAHSPFDSSSSTASAGSSPKTKRRTSPSGVTPKVIQKKKPASGSKDKPEKRIGRRRGPLRPEQREQAHEIRKLRACLRCKFLKKVCDKGNPCGGCQPSHARLWQVPCTRIDIKDIGYFIKDWNADYERHVTLGFSIANIKGFDSKERLLYITHGYGYVMPIWAREVYVRDENCFGLDWIESKHETPREFEVQTAKLSAGAEGISKKMVSDYVDLHLDSGFDHFINEYFEGTPFLSELLKSINRHYLATKQENIRKGLRLVIAYALTLHITMINGLTEEEASVGKIEDPSSRYFGETCAPVMINFQVKKAMADLWRELMKEVLEELSALYSSVYAGSKQKNWPTIFMLAALILGVWEMMQFDCHYRVPDEGAVTKFCGEMEHVPVGVIVGLFGAISTKLPGFQEWDSRKHGTVFSNNAAVCDTMTEVRGHIEKHETYLRTRNEAKFCRDDFDSLSNKFLSKLVIRA